MFILAGCGNEKNSDRDSAKGKQETKEKTVSKENEKEENSEKDKEKNKVEKEEEETLHTITLDLSKSDRPEVLMVTMEGEFDSSAYLQNRYNIDVVVSDVIGMVGCPVEVNLGTAREGKLIFTVDEKSCLEVPMKNMIVLVHNEETDMFEEVESEVIHNNVEFTITESGTYLLSDRYEWYDAWGVTLIEYAHDITYDNREYNFKVVIPQKISFDKVGDYWRYDDGAYYGLYRKMLLNQKNDDISGNFLPMQMYMYAYRFPNESDDLEQPRSVVTLDEFVDEVKSAYEAMDLNEEGYLYTNVRKKHFRINNGKNAFMLTWDMEVGVVNDATIPLNYKFYSVYYEYDEETFIQLQYVVDTKMEDEEIEKVILDSFHSFRYLD